MSAPETLDVDALPLPSERSDDIEQAREAHYEEPRHRFSGDPDDGPIDSDASFRAWQRLGIPLRFLPSLDDLDKSTAPHT